VYAQIAGEPKSVIDYYQKKAKEEKSPISFGGFYKYGVYN
jgi:hypothetical protein